MGCVAGPGLAGLDLVWMALALLDLAWLGLNWFFLAWFGLFSPGLA